MRIKTHLVRVATSSNHSSSPCVIFGHGKGKKRKGKKDKGGNTMLTLSAPGFNFYIEFCINAKKRYTKVIKRYTTAYVRTKNQTMPSSRV